ncbi:MAG: LTA synthase family protein [Halioglobus sp.]
MYLRLVEFDIKATAYHLQPELWLLVAVLTLSKLRQRGLEVNYPLSNRLAELFIAVVLGFLFLASLISLVVFNVVGMLPRFQQLSGLTWDIIGRSVQPLVYGSKYALAASLVLFLVWLYGLSKMAHFSRSYYSSLTNWLSLTAIAFLLLPFLFISGSYGNLRLLGLNAFDNDLLKPSVMPSADVDFRTYFANFDRELKNHNGLKPEYENSYEQIKGGNIVFLVLESVRAKDIPLYGGDVPMPNLMSLSENSIVFNNMYAQDVRSTKAFAAFDMGRFSLTTWNSYSKHLTLLDKEQSLPYLLTRDGYRTSVFTSGTAIYDRHKQFQKHRGYQTVRYRKEINGKPKHLADDLKLLENFEGYLKKNGSTPFYSMLWPIATHHPYGYEAWKDSKKWLKENPDGASFYGKDNYARYRQALKDTDNFIGELVALLKRQSVYQNTTLIIVGDHGEAFSEIEQMNVIHGLNLYEMSVHVPGVIHHPAIDRKYEDKRYVPHRDLAASIYHISHEDNYLLNHARSLFMSYQSEMPVYMSHTGTDVKGIVYDGYKLRVDADHRVFFQSVENLRKDDQLELTRVDALEGRSADLYDKLRQWSGAMDELNRHELNRGDTGNKIPESPLLGL